MAKTVKKESQETQNTEQDTQTVPRRTEQTEQVEQTTTPDQIQEHPAMDQKPTPAMQQYANELYSATIARAQEAAAAEQARRDEILNNPRITKLHVQQANQTLQEYKQGKKNLEQRLIENEEFWKLNHWSQIQAKHLNANDPKPTSAWLFNSINNKHADAMDNFPEPNILPREQSDKTAANMLSDIVPVVLERTQFEEAYSSAWWDKLKGGTAAYGVFWDKSALNGLGDIAIRPLEMLNIFWQPGIKRIEESRNLFIVELIDNDLLNDMYPDLHLTGGSALDVSEYHYDDTVDTSKKSAVVDWYYKKGGKLHYVQYVNDDILYASENDPEYADRGFYDDGEYPVVFDVLFEEKGTPAGFGYIDIMKDPQMYIDKMDSAFVKNATLLSKPRYFVNDAANINEEEFADFSKDFVHVSGRMDDTGVKRIETQEIPSSYLTIKQQKVDELKETSGNNDFSQGSTGSGVTAASAIAALQEAGSKTARDMIKGSYRAYTQICNKVIERIRQFYDEPRSFRITGQNNTEQFVTFDNSSMQAPGMMDEFGTQIQGRLPVFDIKVKAQKASPFSRVSQNELAKELFGLGVFNPEMADQAYALIEMMDFEGKDEVQQRIQQNGLMAQKIMQMQQQMMMMAQLIGQTTGDNRLTQALMAQNGMDPSQPIPNASGDPSSNDMYVDALGAATNDRVNSTAGKARARAASQSTPRV